MAAKPSSFARSWPRTAIARPDLLRHDLYAIHRRPLKPIRRRARYCRELETCYIRYREYDVVTVPVARRGLRERPVEIRVVRQRHAARRDPCPADLVNPRVRRPTARSLRVHVNTVAPCTARQSAHAHRRRVHLSVIQI